MIDGCPFDGSVISIYVVPNWLNPIPWAPMAMFCTLFLESIQQDAGYLGVLDGDLEKS